MLLHGFGSSGALAWEREVGELSKHFRLFIPDLLFFGGSHIIHSNNNNNNNKDLDLDLDQNLNLNQTKKAKTTTKKKKTKKKKSSDDDDDEYGGKLIHHDNNHDGHDDETGHDGHDGWGLVKEVRQHGVVGNEEDRRSEIFQAHCIYGALQKCGIGAEGAKIFVCGHSYGGFVAYRLAHLYGPSYVHKVIIVSSGIMMDHRSNDPLLRASGYGTIHELLVPDSPTHLKTSLKFSLNYLPPFLPNFIFKDMFQVQFFF